MTATKVILTAGLNELPLLVASYAICREARSNGDAIPEFAVLCSTDSAETASRVRDLLLAKLGIPAQQVKWELFSTDDPWSPKHVDTQVRRLLEQRVAGQPIHVHYTGGTAVMTAQVLSNLREKTPVMSYLSVQDNLIYRQDGSAIPLSPSAADERYEWALPLADLAMLHGFTTASQSNPPDDLIDIGVQMMSFVVQKDLSAEYQEALKGPVSDLRAVDFGKRHDRQWAYKNKGKFQLRLPELPSAGPDWTSLIDAARKVIIQSGEADLARMPDAERRAWYAFIHNQCLELMVFRALREAFDELGGPTPDIRHSTKCSKRNLRQDFELDVTAVCGYQLLVVSCTLSSADTKLKAFEAAHRSRQIGGQHARAVVVSMQKPGQAAQTQDLLADTIGRKTDAPQVWGKDVCSSVTVLKNKFKQFLKDSMQWPK